MVTLSHKENHSDSTSAKRVFILISLLALAFRIYFSLILEPSWYATDSYQYVRQSDAILAGDWVTGLPNGYPLLISLFSLIFQGQRDLALILFNCLSWGIIVVIVFALTRRRLQNDWWACLAAGIVALWPSHLIWTRSILSDVPAALFLTLGMALIWSRRHIIGSLCLGISFIIRPSLLPVVFLLIVVLADREGWKRMVMTLCLSCLPTIAVTAYSSTKTIQHGESNFAISLMLAYVHRSDRSAFHYNRESVGEAAEIYLKRMIAEPVNYLKLRIHFLNELWGPWPERNQARAGGQPVSSFRNALIGIQFSLFFLAIIAVALCRDRWSLFFALPAIALTGVHVVLFATARYNLPAIPLLSVLATAALYTLSKRLAGTQTTLKKLSP